MLSRSRQAEIHFVRYIYILLFKIVLYFVFGIFNLPAKSYYH